MGAPLGDAWEERTGQASSPRPVGRPSRHGRAPLDPSAAVGGWTPCRGGSPMYDLPSLRPYPVAAGLPYHSLPKERPALNDQVRLSLQASRQVELGRRLAAKLDDLHSPQRQAIRQALVRFSSEQVAADEFARSCEYLGDLESIHGYLQAEVGLVVVFLPQNLPLYSLVLFAVVPALQARRVVVHFPGDEDPHGRARQRAAHPAQPVYRLVFGQLNEMMRQVVREMFEPPGSPSSLGSSGSLSSLSSHSSLGSSARPTLSRGGRLRSLWRGGWVHRQAQGPEMQVQLNDFGLITHDCEALSHPREPRFADLFSPAELAHPRVKEAAEACLAAAKSPTDLDRAYWANQAARGVCAKVLAEKADVVIFTGGSSRAREVRQSVGQHGLLLVNGSGFNPVVIGPQSERALDNAVAKTVHARLFHNGQDCAAPDAILVERSMLPRFLAKLQAKIAEAMGAQGARMLPLLSKARFDAACAFIRDGIEKKHAYEVLSGSGNNGVTQSLEPTVVLQSIDSRPERCGHFYRTTGNKIHYQEFYAPVFYLLSYVEGSSDLSFYFHGGKYHENEMYVSSFGACSWLQGSLPRSVILTNETVFDIDKGIRGYGAMGADSTYAVHRGTLKIGPVQVPREIARFYQRRVKSSAEAHRGALAPRVEQRAIQATRERFCASAAQRIHLVMREHNYKLSPSLQPRLEAAFFYGPVVDDDFPFSEPATLGGAGGQSFGHSERVNMLVIFDRAIESPAARRSLNALPADLTRSANWAFNERSSIVVTSATVVYDAFRYAHHSGAAFLNLLLHSALEGPAMRYLHIIEGLAAKRRMWCHADREAESSETYRRWCGKAGRIYRRWQEAIHSKLQSENFFTDSSAVSRRYAQRQDIIVSDAMHMRASR